MAIGGCGGEWAEMYALLLLASSGRLYLGDANLQRLDPEQYLPIQKITWEGNSAHPVEFLCDENRDEVEVIEAGNPVHGLVRRDVLAAYARKMRDCSDSLATSIVEDFPGESSLKIQAFAPQTEKSYTTRWFIKSELGSAPTLLNAGRTTNFVYRIEGMDPGHVDAINAIETKAKVLDRINAIERLGGRLVFDSMENQTFRRNLCMIDSRFPEVVAHALLGFYRERVSLCAESVALLEAADPLSLGEGMYEFKFKKFLAAVALGMTPAKPWDGRDDATGGYIVVTKDGDVVAFHIYNRNWFEDYLLQSTRFDTASTTRHGFASVEVHNGVPYMRLNLQIRFC